MKRSATERYKYLVRHNHFLLLTDQDWEKIFSDVKTHEESFARYYPLTQVNMDDRDLVYLGQAFVLNDDFYRFCQKLLAEEAES